MTPGHNHHSTIAASDRHEWQQPALEAALDGCASCRAFVAQLDLVVDTLGAVPPAPHALAEDTLTLLTQQAGLSSIPPPPVGLADSILDHVRHHENHQSRAETDPHIEPWKPSTRILAVVAAAAILVVVAASLRTATVEPPPRLMALANATAAAGPYDFTVQATTSVDLDVPPVAAEPLVAPELSVPNEDPSLSTGERLAELAAASLAASRDIDRAIEAAQERADQAASSVQQDWGSGIDNLQLQAAVEQIQSDLPAIVESQRARADTAVAMLSTRGRATNNAMATLTTGRQADLAAAQDAVSAFATQVDSASTELVVLEQAMSPRSVVVQSTNSGVYRPAGDTTGQPQVSFGVATSQGLLLIEQPDDDLALDPISIIESPDDVLALLQVATPISRDSFTVDLGELDGTPDPLADLQWQGTVQTEDEVLDGLVLTGRGGPTTVDIFVDLDQL